MGRPALGRGVGPRDEQPHVPAMDERVQEALRRSVVGVAGHHLQGHCAMVPHAHDGEGQCGQRLHWKRCEAPEILVVIPPGEVVG